MEILYKVAFDLIIMPRQKVPCEAIALNLMKLGGICLKEPFPIDKLGVMVAENKREADMVKKEVRQWNLLVLVERIGKDDIITVFREGYDRPFNTDKFSCDEKLETYLEKLVAKMESEKQSEVMNENDWYAYALFTPSKCMECGSLAYSLLLLGAKLRLRASVTRAIRRCNLRKSEPFLFRFGGTYFPHIRTSWNSAKNHVVFLWLLRLVGRNLYIIFSSLNKTIEVKAVSKHARKRGVVIL